MSWPIDDEPISIIISIASVWHCGTHAVKRYYTVLLKLSVQIKNINPNYIENNLFYFVNNDNRVTNSLSLLHEFVPPCL